MSLYHKQSSAGPARAGGLTCASIILACLAGCGGMPPVVPDAEGVESVSAIGMGCNKPYKLTRSCSGFSGATREVRLSGVEFKIAGTEDGTVVLIMNARQLSNAARGKSTEASNIAYEVAKKHLVDRGVEIRLVEPVASGSLLAGYIVTTDADGYALLSEFATEE